MHPRTTRGKAASSWRGRIGSTTSPLSSLGARKASQENAGCSGHSRCAFSLKAADHPLFDHFAPSLRRRCRASSAGRCASSPTPPDPLNGGGNTAQWSSACHPLPRVADFKSEWPRSNRNQWPTSFRDRRPTSPGICTGIQRIRQIIGRRTNFESFRGSCSMLRATRTRPR
jgi:hypothetical protein